MRSSVSNTTLSVLLTLPLLSVKHYKNTSQSADSGCPLVLENPETNQSKWERLQRTRKWAGVPSWFCVRWESSSQKNNSKVLDVLQPTVHRHQDRPQHESQFRKLCLFWVLRKVAPTSEMWTSVYCHKWHKPITKGRLSLLWVRLSFQHSRAHRSDHQNQVHSVPQPSEFTLGQQPCAGSENWLWLASPSSQDFSPRWHGSTGPSSSERPVSTVITREAKEGLLAIGCSSAENREKGGGGSFRFCSDN